MTARGAHAPNRCANPSSRRPSTPCRQSMKRSPSRCCTILERRRRRGLEHEPRVGVVPEKEDVAIVDEIAERANLVVADDGARRVRREVDEKDSGLRVSAGAITSRRHAKPVRPPTSRTSTGSPPARRTCSANVPQYGVGITTSSPGLDDREHQVQERVLAAARNDDVRAMRSRARSRRGSGPRSPAAARASRHSRYSG